MSLFWIDLWLATFCNQVSKIYFCLNGLDFLSNNFFLSYYWICETLDVSYTILTFSVAFLYNAIRVEKVDPPQIHCCSFYQNYHMFYWQTGKFNRKWMNKTILSIVYLFIIVLLLWKHVLNALLTVIRRERRKIYLSSDGSARCKTVSYDSVASVACMQVLAYVI